MEREMLEQIEAVHRSYKRELVRWQPPGEVLLAKDAQPFKIAIQRPSGSKDPDEFQARTAADSVDGPEPVSEES
jgi:hypothetical protein